MFRVTAVNKYGTSPYSDMFAVIAAQEPDQPSAPETKINGLYIEITWDAPSDNNADITSYQVLLKESDDQFAESKTLCDGASMADPNTFGTRLCLIPMNTFREIPYSLLEANLIEVKIVAINERGSSLASPANIVGAEIEVEPAQISDLSQSAETSYQQVAIEWTEPLNGGSTILTYVIHWDQGLGTGIFEELVGQPS